MARNLPVNFPIPGETAVASYDYTDVAEGTGIQKFYLTSETTNATISYMLSEIVEACSVAGDTNDSILQLLTTASHNFDLTAFNAPRRIKGNAFLSFRMKKSDANANKLKITLKKVSGAAVTNITSQITSQSAVAALKYGLLKLPITTLVNFKKGDILRLNVENDIADGSVLYLGINPLDTASAAVTMASTKSTLYIPFMLDL